MSANIEVRLTPACQADGFGTCRSGERFGSRDEDPTVEPLCQADYQALVMGAMIGTCGWLSAG